MLKLSKYRTLGSAFVMVDNRDGQFNELSTDDHFKKHLCHPSFGIGSIGIMELRNHEKYSFDIIYHTAVTGKRGVACGTGSRVSVAFARDLGIVEDGIFFLFHSHEGERTGRIDGDLVTTTMSDESCILTEYDTHNYLVDPKCYIHVRFIDTPLEDYKVVEEGVKVAGMDEYKSIFPRPAFMVVKSSQEEAGGIAVRSFDIDSSPLENFGCGTGETASAMVYATQRGLVGEHVIPVQWRDGETTVTLRRREEGGFSDIRLKGPAIHLFDVTVDVEEFRKTCTLK